VLLLGLLRTTLIYIEDAIANLASTLPNKVNPSGCGRFYPYGNRDNAGGARGMTMVDATNPVGGVTFNPKSLIKDNSPQLW